MRITLLTFIAIIATAINPAEAQQKVIAEEIVAVVGNQSISLSDLYEATNLVIQQRKEYGVSAKIEPAEEALESLLTQKLLASCARLDSLDKDMPVSEEDIQDKLDKMTKQAGSIKELEKITGKAIFQLREDYKRDVQETTLSQLMNREVRLKVKITHSEVEQFFKTLNVDSLSLMPPQISYAQIVKTPPATEERKYEVRQRLLEFRERIMNGEKMAVLARLYSQDPGTKSNGGEYKSKYIESVAPFSEAVKLMKPGQISEIVETEFGFHLIELISSNDEEFTVRHILLKPEFKVDEERTVIAELDSIAGVIREGKMTFADAAARHSDDVDTKMNGGITFNTQAYFASGGDMREASTRFFLDQVNPMDGRTLNRLKIGEVSAPYQNMDNKGNFVYKIVTVLEMIPAHKLNMADDFVQIETYALQTKQEKVFNEWVDKAIKKMYIYINPEYMSYNFEREGWKQQSEKSAEK